MIASLHHRGWHYLLLIGIGGLVFFLNLGGATLWDVDEGRNSSCAQAMMEAADWIKPTFNGNLRVEKPALLYWLQIFAYIAFGVNEFAARFPSAVAALVTVLLTYELARSMFTRTTGLLAALIVATTPMLCGAGRFANPDALLNCFTVMTLAIFWIGLTRRGWWWYFLLGASTGLGMLAKGPVGVVLPGAVCMLYILWNRQWQLLWDRRWLGAVVSFILTAVPWYLWVGIETHGEFLTGFFWKHNLERGMSAMENHHGFPGYYLVILLVGTMPWSIFLPAACWFGFWSTIRCPFTLWENLWSRASEVGSEEKTDSLTDMPAAYRLLFAWILVYVIFFSLAATKLPNYVLPAVAPIAILIARLLQRWRTETLRLPAWLLAGAVIALLGIGGALSFGLAAAGGVGEFPFMRGHYFDGLQQWAFLGVMPIVAALGGAWFMWQRQYSRFIVALSVTALVLLAPLAAFGSALFNHFKAPRALVEQANLLRRDEDIRIGCWHMEHLPSLNFYVQRNVQHLSDEQMIPGFLSYRVPVYLFMPAEDWQRMKGSLNGVARVVGRQYDFYHRAEIVVVTNR